MCLEFTDTVDWRTSGHSIDKLGTYEDLVNWSRSKGLIDNAEVRRLFRIARSEETKAARTLEQAKELREAIYRIFSAAAKGEKPSASDVAILNINLSKAMAQMEVQVTEAGYRLGWCADEMVDKMLYPIVKSAAELITSESLQRLRECANQQDGCGSLFLDNSKSHSRRWCSMESCGNKVKLRTYYQRHRKR